MINQTHEADGIDLLVSPVTFDPGTASTLTGAAVRAFALNKLTGTKYEGSALVVTGTSVRVTFAPGALPAGTYSVQLIATPPGYRAQTIYDEEWQVQKSGGTA